VVSGRLTVVNAVFRIKSRNALRRIPLPWRYDRHASIVARAYIARAEGISFATRETPIATEFELKLAVPPTKLEKLKRVLLAMPGVRSEVRWKLVSTYYDTPTLALRRQGLRLRVRKLGREFIQTVKAENLADLDMLERQEWEEPVLGMRPDLDAPKTGKRLPDAVREEEVRPIFTTTVTRTVIAISPLPPEQIEAAIDEGEIRVSNGAAVEPISEIELELKNGAPGPLFDVALQLLEVAPIRIEMRAKVERGYRLLGGDGSVLQAVCVGPVALDPSMTVEAALERIGRRCLTHFLYNEPAALAGEPEGIHQMRVAIRRLRSALSALKRALQKHYRWTSEELTWFAHTLGPVRNWDIFVDSLLRPVAKILPVRTDLERLIGASERLRHTALDDAKQAIVSERYTRSMLRLLRWFAAREWRDQQISKHTALLLTPIVNAAPNLIERHHRRVRKRSKRFEELTATQRHKLRIAVKKLHYTIQFLGNLFDKDQVQKFVKCLRSLQDDLGHENDVRVAHDLVAQFQQTMDHDARVNRAGGVVLGWHERDLVDREPKVRKHIRRFRRLDPFW
jgi:inorganic triphosphatase YgiF